MLLRRSFVALLVIAAPVGAQTRPLVPFKPTPERSLTAFVRAVDFARQGLPGALVPLDFKGNVMGVRIAFPQWREKGLITVGYGRQPADAAAGRPERTLLDVQVQAWSDVRLSGRGATQVRLASPILLTYRRFGLGQNTAGVRAKGLLLGDVGVGLAFLARKRSAILEVRAAPTVGVTLVGQKGLSLPPLNLGFEGDVAVRWTRGPGRMGFTLGLGFRQVGTHMKDDRLFPTGDGNWFLYRSTEFSPRLGIAW